MKAVFGREHTDHKDGRTRPRQDPNKAFLDRINRIDRMEGQERENGFGF